MRKFKLHIGIFLMLSGTAFAQEWSAFQWKNRLIIVEDVDYYTESALEQLQRLEDVKEELVERKVKVIAAQGKSFRIGSLFRNRDESAKPLDKFEVRLIGLDGGVKFRSDKVVDPQVLIDLIDSMPMRRAEMRKKGG